MRLVTINIECTVWEKNFCCGGGSLKIFGEVEVEFVVDGDLVWFT